MALLTVSLPQPSEEQVCPSSQVTVTTYLFTCSLLYGAVHNDFEAGSMDYEGHRKGWAREIETFLGPEMATSGASAIWSQKVTLHTGNPPAHPYRSLDGTIKVENNFSLRKKILFLERIFSICY